MESLGMSSLQSKHVALGDGRVVYRTWKQKQDDGGLVRSIMEESART